MTQHATRPDAFGPIMQHGYVVHDVAEAAHRWAERVGAGPFYVLEHLVMDHYVYRGLPTPLELRLAFGYWGPIQIELIQPLNAAETLYSDALRHSAGILNHCATVVADIDGLLAARQLQDRVLHAGAMPTGVRFVYLERYLPDGCHLELIQAPQSTLAAFGGMQAAAQHWNGERPLRPMADLAADLGAAAPR